MKTHQFWCACLGGMLWACGSGSSGGSVGDAGREPGGTLETPDASTIPDGRAPNDAGGAHGDMEDAATPGSVGDAAATSDAGDQLPNGSLDGGDSVAACRITAANARCDSRSVMQIGAASDRRRVYWAQPTRTAPEGGYPAVILYQGSFIGPSYTWDDDVPVAEAFGGFYQVKLVAELLDHGFVVVQPEAQGGTYWSTNTAADYATSVDGVFIPLLLDAIEQGAFGQVDLTSLFATGISSGGYMTSRMAVSYPGRFRALAIESASYATCAGPVCNVPATLPSNHPPTLFLHGDQDTIVPISTAKTYYGSLMNNGVPTKFIEDPQAGHQWLSSAPDEVVQWFLAH